MCSYFFSSRSGTDEDITEKDRLLQDLNDWSDSIKEDQRKQKVDEQNRKDSDVNVAKAVREAALSGMGKCLVMVQCVVQVNLLVRLLVTDLRY